MKVKTLFFCSSCGSSTPKWMGKCPACGEWNTLQEEDVEKQTSSDEKSQVWKTKGKERPVPRLLAEVSGQEAVRTDTGDAELNRVLGGGLVAGSVILVGGQPGIGKSTLLLQLALRQKRKVLYVSGEESEDQIKMRAQRLDEKTNSCYIYTEVNVSQILKEAVRMASGAYCRRSTPV